jgi:murein tripeptide amidase MpaA
LKQIDVQTEPHKKKPYVVIVGRQHPPEVTGALALMPFVEAALSDTDLSKAFLDKFNLLVIPMINPDGVEDGNWRFNTGGMDLNRDWGPFSQPETRAVRNAFERFHENEDEVIFFLDFHSTGRNLLYTQADDEATNPPMFTRDWVAAVKARLDNDVYPFTREARHNSGRPISKNYMYDSFGIPSITYEVGDETPRAAIEQSAIVFSEEMMKQLLKHADKL